MKLTEEHYKFAAHQANLHTSPQPWSTDTDESHAFAAIKESVCVAIKEFGGIQWKPYNLDNLPPVESFQGLILFKSGHMEIATWIVRDEEPGYDWYWPSAYYARQEDITHWAEINLPNQ